MNPAYLVNCSLVLADLPMLERPAAARAAGFDAVEFWWPFADAVPGDAEVGRFVGAVRDAGVQLVGLNFFAGDMAAGDRGVLSAPSRSEEFLDSVDVAVGIGQQLGVSGFNALYGNRLPGVDPAEQDDVALENLAAAGKRADAIGAILFLEPVSGAERYPLRTAADVVAVLDGLEARGASNAGLLADLYHLSVNGDDVDALLEAHLGRVRHLQIADAPGRGEPGTGDLPLTRWIAEAYARGYTGWTGLEYKPTGVDPFAWLPLEARSARALD